MTIGLVNIALVEIVLVRDNTCLIIFRVGGNQVSGGLPVLLLLRVYTAGGFVWCDRPFYLVKQPQEKWACDFHDDASPLSIIFS